MCIIINMHVHTVYAQGTFYARPRVTPAGLQFLHLLVHV